VKLCLASTSPRRAQLLATAGIKFFTCDPCIHEVSGGELSPAALAATNARLKAHAVAKLHADAVVLGADTVVSLEGEIFGKPCDLTAAHEMLFRLGGKWHEVFTAVCICPPMELDSSSKAPVEFVESTRVLLRGFSCAERGEYFAKINPLDKAGAYAAQDTSSNLVEAMDGSFSNVVGLPLEALCKVLKESFPRFFS
jgi:septum formation protein